MRRLLSSNRGRRRLIAAGVVALVGAGIASLALFTRNTADVQERAPGTKPAEVYKAPVTVPLAAADRATAHDTAVDFILTAVRRENVDVSYDLVAPSLKRGISRSQWHHGNIPVVPYPADAPEHAPWKVLASYSNRLLLEFALLPKPGQALRGQVFDMELAASGAGDKRHWLVSSWVPHASGPAYAAQTPRTRSSTPLTAKGPLSPLWLLVPFGALGLLLAVAIGLGVREWVRGARARRTYGSSSRPFS